MSEYGLLKGIRVIDLCTYVAGPASVKLLADMGADVIKVEPAAGDNTRFGASAFEVPSTLEEGPIYEIYNFGKRNISIDLKTKQGMEVFYKLLETADVFVTSNRQKALEKMGLDYDSLKERFPGLVYGHLLGFGDKGPLKDYPGLDSTAFMARSGIMTDIAKEGDCLSVTPYAFGDTSTGTALFGAICAALVHKQRTGEGKRVAVSLYGASIWYGACMVACTQEAYGAKFPKKRSECIPTATTYCCADGEWVLPTVLNYALFRPMCKALEMEEIADDPKFSSFGKMMKHTTELVEIFEKAFKRFDSKEVIKRMLAANIPCDAVYHYKDVSKDEQAWANDYLTEVTFRNGHKAVLPQNPITISGDTRIPFKHSAYIGENTMEILKDLGYSEAECEDMVKNNIVASNLPPEN